MSIPLSGPISVSTISDEFGGTVPHSLSEYYRGAGLVPTSPQNSLIPSSGALPMGSFYGAADRPVVPLVISANTANYDAYTNFINSPAYPSYVAGLSTISITVNPGVVVSSTSTGTYAMSIPSAFNPGDAVTLINSGTIIGMGGGGGAGGTASNFGPSTSGGNGGVGGNALYVNRPVTVTNNGILAGGGGGGGGGGAGRVGAVPSISPTGPYVGAPGGGGGGGAGVNNGAGVGAGVPGTPSSGGAGGPPITVSIIAGTATGGAGGAGGGRGAAGVDGSAAPNFFGAVNGVGGGAGNYVVGSPFVVWNVTGNRYGGSA